MNKAVELINAWANFDARQPGASLEDFCRQYLTERSQKDDHWQSSKWPAPVSVDFALMRMSGRIVKLLSIYALAASDGTGINTLDEFSLLNAVQNLKEPRKTEAIYMSLFELSTGTDMLNRLKKIGFISETDDKEDRRSKRIKLTPKGQKALVACRKRIEQLAEMMFHEMSMDEKKLCIQLLSKVESKFSNLWQEHKGNPFEEIYNDVMS